MRWEWAPRFSVFHSRFHSSPYHPHRASQIGSCVSRPTLYTWLHPHHVVRYKKLLTYYPRRRGVIHMLPMWERTPINRTLPTMLPMLTHWLLYLYRGVPNRSRRKGRLLGQHPHRILNGQYYSFACQHLVARLLEGYTLSYKSSTVTWRDGSKRFGPRTRRSYLCR